VLLCTAALLMCATYERSVEGDGGEKTAFVRSKDGLRQMRGPLGVLLVAFTCEVIAVSMTMKAYNQQQNNYLDGRCFRILPSLLIHSLN
jgi:hypothetical protein